MTDDVVDDRTPGERARDDVAAVALKETLKIIERSWAPNGPDKTDVLRRLNLQILMLRRGVQDKVCQRCGARYPFFRREQFSKSKGRYEFAFCPTCRGVVK
jgi:hypothetical protein